ncbi:sodium channel protein type 5 subunit alpha-like [Thamnophis elegans]|uniref:sodium channel protein type 5 subunit alpha-like n=1 Tax=Thamnophis elegans TaxID=35005 RepID=UPI001376885C|nr:sodium channel protein type 5 subunit alpha-like [Thamnophis elegans]
MTEELRTIVFNSQGRRMPNFSFSTAHNFLRFTPESLDAVRKRIAEKKANRSKASEKDNNETEEENIQPQLDLKVLKKLPILYGKPPPWLIGEPLEDVDAYYRDHETFMVLSSRSRIFRFTASKSLFLFSPFHPLRRLAIKILIHVIFIAFITCVVLVNCVFMALNNPPTDGNTTEIIFTSLYTAEFVIKVVARGFVCNEFTYLRDPWNVLDFFVLIMTYVAFNQKFGSISALRIFRILRTLKAVSVIPGLKVIISSLLQSVKKLANVMLLTVFFLAVFALVGLQLFMGNLRYNCVPCSDLTENLNKTHCLLKDKEWEESKFEFPPSLKETLKKHLIWQCCSLWLQIKNILKKIMINPLMELFITLCIIANTMLMALENLSLSSEQSFIVLMYFLQVFTAIFTAEMVLKMIALDPYYYFQCSWNVFDFTVVIISIINLFLKMRSPIFRTLRIFKLSKFWPALNKLMKIMLKSVGPLGNLTLVLIFTVFIFAVVGKQAFGNYYSAVAANASICNNNSVPNCPFHNSSETCQLRWHMKDFLHSFLIIFRILCGEWISTMWECMQVAGEGRCIILFMLVLVLGNLVVLNLFIALLLSSFSSSDSEIEADDHKPEPGKSLALIQTGLRFVRLFLWDWCCHVFLKKLRITGPKKKNETTAIERSCDSEHMKEISENFARKESFGNWDKLPWDRKQEDFVTDYTEIPTIPLAELETLSVEDSDLCTLENNLRKRREIGQGQNRRLSSQVSETTSIWSLEVPKRSDYDTSCSEISTVDQRSPILHMPEIKKEPQDCFPQVFMKLFPCCRVNTDKFPGNTWWRFRKTCYKIIKHNWFESFIIFMILLSSGALIFEDIYLAKRKVIKKILKYADVFFFCIFFLEMLLKWVAYGFTKYFTDGWCILDFFIVCVSTIYFLVGPIACDSNISTKSLRTLRALRPLRALSRFKGIKVVVNALAGAIPSIGNVLLVCIVLWLPFNILGVQLFGGKFSCWDVENENSCINMTINFNHVGNGYLALLQVATFKGWMDIMYAAVDSASDNSTQPCFENNVYSYIYFVVFIIFGSFFMLNLFIGVVIDNFNQQRKKISGELIFLSEDQKKYYNALKKLGTKKPHKTIPRPLNQFQGFLFDIVNKQAFELFIISLIFLNVVVMAVEYEGQDVAADQLLEKINFVFVALFTGECVMKLLALRLYFFKDSWNIFDLVVVILSIISLAATQLWRRLNFPPTILRVIRVVRISRLLRLIRGARGLRTLLFALLMSLPALTNIGLLLFLIMFIYAIFGMANFSCASWVQGIDDIFNFQTFGNSMLCLFQMTTSAGWDELLGPMLLHQDNYKCAPNIKSTPQKSPCVNNKVAIAYFVSYIIISFLIVVNMYIAVIIENLNVATEESTEPLGDDDFEIFYEIWAKFDPKATQFISYSALSNFADALEEPLRIPKPNSHQLLSMDLPIVNGSKIHCLDILFAFTKRVLGESGEMDSFESQIEEKYPEKIAYEPIVTTPKRKQDESAVIIQRAFRMHLLQHAGKEAPQEPYVTISLENIPEEENLSVFSLSENEGSQSSNSQNSSSVVIPPSYSNATSITPDIQQEGSSGHKGDTK